MCRIVQFTILMGLVPILTTINLQHTLSIEGQPLRSSSTPIESNFIPPDYTNSNSGLQPPPPPDTDFDVRSRPPPPPPPDSESEYGNPRRAPPPPPPPDFENNQFGFKPAPTKHGLAPGNNFHFKPQMPKDPSKIYPTNPFFLSSTSRPTRTDFHPGNNPDNSKNFNIPKVDIPAEKDTEFISKDGVLENIPFRNVCGKPLSTNSLIINGDVVPRGAFPWLVAIFGVKVTGLNYMCSASLISDRHVVTAAHCVRTESKRYRPQDILIILGKMNIQKWVPIEGEKMIEPESIHVHPDYKSFTSDADIAMIVLSDRVQFTKYIRPLCLWTGSTELETIIGKQGTVVGWGKDENGVLMTAEPKQTKLPIVSQEQCLRSSYQFQYITSNRTFCAGFRNGSGPCNGDSGSGFIMQREGRWFLKGVVSMAVSDTQTRTCDLSNYVVFTDASKFLSWLLSFVK